MTTLTAGQQAEVEKAATRLIFFVKMEFLSGTQYLNSWNIPVEWDGHTWQGLGEIGSISEIQESDSLEAKALQFAMKAADLSWIGLANGDAAEFRKRPLTIWYCPLDEQYRLIDTPIRAWKGIMDMMSTGIEGDTEQAEGKIVLQCENAAIRLMKPSTKRMNEAQQKEQYPDDTGFQYQLALLSESHLWLSTRFQQLP
jgi:hypothetical protein